MNLLLRLLLVIIHACCRAKISFWQNSVTHFHVLPNDLDINMHMTNSRYLSIMDLGRMDYLVRSDLGRLLVKNKWRAVLGAANIRYRRPLQLFQKYNVRTCIIGIDEKWCYIEQRFESKGELMAYALVKAIFMDRTSTIPIKQILNHMNLPTTLRPVSDMLLQWSEMDKAIKIHIDYDK